MIKIRYFLTAVFFLFLLIFSPGNDFQNFTFDFTQVNFYEYNNFAITPDGRYCFIPDSFNDRLYRVNLMTNSVESISVDDDPVGVYLTKDGSILAVVCAGTVGLAGDKIDLIRVNEDSLNVFTKVEGDFNFGYYNNVVFTSDNLYGFIASYNTGYIYCFDTYSGEVLASIYIGLNVNNIAISPDNKKIAVQYSVNGFSNIGVIDVSITSYGVSLSVDNIFSTGSSFFEKSNIIFDNSGNYLLFPSDSNNKIIIYDISSGSVYKEINCSGGAVKLFKSVEENMAYSILPSSNSILFLDLKDFTSFEKSYPYYFSEDSFLSYVPEKRFLIVSATGSNKVLFLNFDNGDVVYDYDVSSNPTYVSSNILGNRVCVLTTGNNKLFLFYRKYEYYLPFIFSNDSYDTGFSFLNVFSGVTSSVSLEPHDINGNNYGIYPFTINYFSQFVRSWTSFNEGNASLPYPFDGWLKVYTEKVPLRGFSMVYRRDEKNMDGYTFKKPSRTVYIPSIYKDYVSNSKIYILNCSDKSCSVKMTFFKSDGTNVLSKYENISPDVRFEIDDILSYFSISQDDILNGGYIKIEASEPILAFLKINSDDNLSFINFVESENASIKGIFPHFATGDDWESFLSLCNLSSKTQDVKVDFFDESGNLLMEKSILLTSHSSFYGSVSSLLGVDGDQLYTGWIEMSGSYKLAGNLFFKYSDELFTQLPLEYSGHTDIYVAQIAQNTDYFTGIALVNNSGEETPVNIYFYTEDGTPILSYKLTSLPDRQKFVRLLSVDPFDILDQIGGFIVIESERPIYSYALFGNLDKFLSAIPSIH